MNRGEVRHVMPGTYFISNHEIKVHVPCVITYSGKSSSWQISSDEPDNTPLASLNHVSGRSIYTYYNGSRSSLFHRIAVGSGDALIKSVL